MRSKRSIPRLMAGVTATSLLLLGGQALPAVAAGGPGGAAGTVAAAGGSHHASRVSSASGSHTAARLDDGDRNSYWQSSGGSLPQWAQIDLGRTELIDKVRLQVPASWSSRKQTLAIQASDDGVLFETLVGAATYSFDRATGNTATVSFPASQARYVRAEVTANSAGKTAQLSEMTVQAAAGSTVNLAAGKATAESGHADVYPSGNAVDGNANTYWESTNNAFPQWLRVDLGSAVPVNKVVLKLPPATAWQTRTETLAVQGSTDGQTFSDIVPSAGYTFDPATGNTVTITFNQATTRYLRLNVTGNTGWPAGQIAELEAYGPATGDTTAPTAPSGLAYTQPASGQIKLTWNAATDDTGVTGYDVYANGTLRTTVAGNVLTYTDSQPDTATVTYFVKAHDAAGNQSQASNSVTRTGTSGDTQPPSAPTALSYTQPASGQIKLTWNAAGDNVAVTGYEVFRDGTQIGTTAAGTLTYTDSQPDSATVSYFVRAKDAAGNESGNSNTVTRTGTTPPTGGTNQAVGKPITASSTVQNFVAANADDDDVTTYWEGTGTSSLTVQLGANVDTSQVVVKLNPAAAWSARTQTIEIQGREQSASGFTQLVAPKSYSFDPATGNTVTIPVSARVADVKAIFSSNSGAGGGQAAELQVIGVPGPNPDLTVTAPVSSPAAPVETDQVTLSTTVKNTGTDASTATNVNFYLGSTKVGTANVGALAAGAAATVSANIGARDAATYQVTAKVDEANTVVEQNETNNSATSSLVVKPVDSSDLLASPVAWSPGNPSAGNNVAFSVAIRNQGTIASAAGAHNVTLTVADATTGNVLKTLTGSYSGAIAAGATTAPVNLGSWTAVNGKYTVKTVIAVDGNELSVKQANNTSTQSLFVGRGANMPYDAYEAENGVLGGGATVLGPNRTIGDPAGEASGRKAVHLAANGASVSFTTRASTNTLVTRFNIPDGTDSTTLDIYVDGTFLKTITLSSKYAWLYGAEASPSNSPGSGAPRHIYDEANVLLGTTVPAGHTITLQKDAANSAAYYNIDYINLEQATPAANPDPTKYVVPAGFTQQDVQNALDTARQDTSKLGVYLPQGDYQTANKFTVYGRAIKVVGAGPWFTRFFTPQAQENTDGGFSLQSGSDGSTFTGFAFFGNYTSRIDGPGKVFDLSNVANLTIDNLWIEHTICGVWGTNVDNSTITNLRIRDTWADGVNLTNGSSGNTVSNDEARSTGDDSFALFPAIDNHNEQELNNTFQNLSVQTVWRAAGLAVYGGGGNKFTNLYIADSLTYPGITIGSLQFGGIPALGFESTPQTTFDNISLARDGGHFWGQQSFPALWVFSAEFKLQGLRISNVDITDPTYSGIMFQTKWNGSTSLNPIQDTVFTNVSITGAHKSGDDFDAKSGFGIWANPQPETGQGPAVGSATFNGLHESDNAVDIQNTTSTFTITVNN